MSARMLSGMSLVIGLGLSAGAVQAAPQYDDYGNGGNVIRCESDSGRQRRCDADTRGGVRMSRQLSKSSCIQGRSWGYDRGGVWVSEGCRAEFELGRGGGWNGGGGGWNGGGSGEVVRCESESGRYRTCPINGNRARLQRQLSSTSCIEGQSWGSRQGEVWVNKGCRGEFVAGRGGGWGGGGGGGWNGGGNGGGWNGGGGQEISCESNNNRQNRCNMSVRRDVRLLRQNSGSPCIEGQTWGWDRAGVWVSGGCRGRFQVD
ncbi:DUF3011 domain-containing protein [Lysobacter gummosus]|uniref:DUF3011 domain-containing protein n=1 Tax=Lysobacter gummosus TaxID=262324 RepID=A0ABY3X477_9GAMM|nr:DUF3011 domain-containing protein [Lysobacter gummosus]UNP27389.1 DUF3011 domain-containing protein [Lysobacter gummosus]